MKIIARVIGDQFDLPKMMWAVETGQIVSALFLHEDNAETWRANAPGGESHYRIFPVKLESEETE